jgi:hypothetical protein
VADDIQALHGLAQRRRAARQAAGALRLDNTKLDFQLDAAGQPVGCTPHEQRWGGVGSPDHSTLQCRLTGTARLSINGDWLHSAHRFEAAAVRQLQMTSPGHAAS